MSLTRQNTVKTLFWSSLNTIQFFLKNIFFISLFLKYRSQQDYGFWIILMSFYGMTVYVVDGYVRYCLNRYNLEFYKDNNAAGRYFRDGLTFLTVISAAILLLLLAIIQYLPLSAAIFNAPGTVVHDHSLHYCLFIIIALSLVHCIVKYIGGGIEPEGKIHINNRYTTIYSIFETLSYFAFIIIDASFISLFAVMLVILFSINGIYLFSLLKKHSVYRQGIWGNVKGGLLLFGRSLLFLANNFFEKFTLDGINFMIAIFYPVAYLLPVYASTRTMANVMVTTGNVFVGTFVIEYQRLSVQEAAAKLMKVLHAIWVLLGVCVNFGLVCLYPFLIRIYMVWTHGKLPVDPLFFHLIFSVVLLNVYGIVIILYFKSLNAIRRLLPVSLFRALSIFFMVLLFPRQPLYLALALLISEFLVNVVLLNVLLYKELVKMKGAHILRALLLNVLPFLLTAIFLPVNKLAHLGDISGPLCMIGLLIVVYALQLSYLGNDLLITNLQFFLSKLKWKKRDS
ncbi:MAG: hypothetical protein BGO69_02590 [Bacteroidetes bacterium 46-16]|nr:MAG: hypothetical protein BGO69_02590 [Bacteroidetes bacterium 46-16]